MPDLASQQQPSKLRLRPKEVWLPVLDYPMYRVSSLGQVFSLKSNKCLKSKSYPDQPYPVVGLYKERKRKEGYIHRLVLLAFEGVPEAGLEACHKDGNPLNNCLSNLYWGTSSQNRLDAFKHGRVDVEAMMRICRPGEDHARAKLTFLQVCELKDKFARGVARVQLSNEYGVCVDHLLKIVRGTRWKHCA